MLESPGTASEPPEQKVRKGQPRVAFRPHAEKRRSLMATGREDIYVEESISLGMEEDSVGKHSGSRLRKLWNPGDRGLSLCSVA